jgi:hypothetical protein
VSAQLEENVAHPSQAGAAIFGARHPFLRLQPVELVLLHVKISHHNASLDHQAAKVLHHL